jgi:hypothetical protein
MITIIILVLLREYPCQEVQCLIFLSHLMQIYLVQARPFPTKAELRMNLFNEVLVSLYLYGYILLSDFSYGYDQVQDQAGLAMLVLIFISIFANFTYMIVNVVLVVRSRFRRWFWLERTCCRRTRRHPSHKRQQIHPKETAKKYLTASSTSVKIDLKAIKHALPLPKPYPKS